MQNVGAAWRIVLPLMLISCCGCVQFPKSRASTEAQQTAASYNCSAPLQIAKTDVPTPQSHASNVTLPWPTPGLPRQRSVSQQQSKDIECLFNESSNCGPLFSRPTFDQGAPTLVENFTESARFDEFDWNADPSGLTLEPSFTARIYADYQNFYSFDSLVKAGLGFGAAGVVANTSIDENLHDVFQSSFHNSFLQQPKKLGNGLYTIPVFAAAWATGEIFDEYPAAGRIGEWGNRSIRSILVGAPPLYVSQYLTGGSRPGESTHGSHWAPFQDNNGVSGHAFMGAVPFLTAAQMTEEPWLKCVFYAGSTLVPLSRINDDAHYPSQAFLGWWLAYLATQAVDRTQSFDTNWKVSPWMTPGSTGIQAEWRY